MSVIRTTASKVAGGLLGRAGRGYSAAVRTRLREICREQWLPAQEVARLQLERLNALLAHATRHVPHYRHLHKGGQMTDHLDRLEQMALVPVLTKAMVATDLRAFVDERVDLASLFVRRSGGSTGEPLEFRVSHDGLAAAGAAEIYGNTLAGYRLGDPLALIWGAKLDAAPPKGAKQKLAAFLRNTDLLVCNRMSDDDKARMVERLNRRRPAVLVGYTASLAEFARYLLAERITPAFPRRGVVATAEVLTPAQRELIERAFGKPVFNRYGTREAGLVAAQCPLRKGLHIVGSVVHADLDEHHTLGDARRVLVTKLREFAMPFIHYDLGDYVRGEIVPCPCGRGFGTVQDVVGRQGAAVRLRDGSFIALQTFVLALDPLPVRQYRVVQEADYRVRLEVVVHPAWNQQAYDTLLAGLGAVLRDVPLEVQIRQEIPLTPSGKLVPVVSYVAEPA